MAAQDLTATGPTESTDVRVSGTIVDKASHRKMENVSITIPNTNISTVTNADGYFLLKLKKRPEHIVVSSIGYQTLSVETPQGHTEGMRIQMVPASITLPELNVWQGDPEALINIAISRIYDNFSQAREMHTSFYRETLQRGGRFIDISEAILATCKKGYSHGIQGDRVKVEHGRHIVSQRAKDTLSVQVLGGPNLPVNLDAVKNEEILIDDIKHNAYSFRMEMPEVLDGKTQIVISFSPYQMRDWPLYFGKVYLDKQTLAFTRIEMSLDVRNQEKATNAMLYKKPLGLRFKPYELTTVINYHDGRINYMKTQFRFKCDWKKHLFSRTYTCVSEMVVTDFESNYEGPNIEMKDRFSDKGVFSKAVNDFTDTDFWKDYNIIEPTESLEKAIDKLKKQ